MFTRVLIAAILTIPFPAEGASSVIGSTNARTCYEESQAYYSYAIATCDKAIRHDQLTRRDLAATYSNRGIIHSRKGELDSALGDHNSAIKLKSDLAQVFINRGNVYHHLKRFEDALTDYQTAIALHNGPLHIPYYNSGLTLLKMHRVEEAIGFLEKALDHAPDSRKIIRQLEDLKKL